MGFNSAFKGLVFNICLQDGNVGNVNRYLHALSEIIFP